MIIKDETKKNKYILTDTSCNDDMRKTVSITINNKIEDNVFYLNSIS